MSSEPTPQAKNSRLGAAPSAPSFKEITSPQDIEDEITRVKQFCRLVFLMYAVNDGPISKEDVPKEEAELFEFGSIFQHLY